VAFVFGNQILEVVVKPLPIRPSYSGVVDEGYLKHFGVSCGLRVAEEVLFDFGHLGKEIVAARTQLLLPLGVRSVQPLPVARRR